MQQIVVEHVQKKTNNKHCETIGKATPKNIEAWYNASISGIHEWVTRVAFSAAFLQAKFRINIWPLEVLPCIVHDPSALQAKHIKTSVPLL